MTFTTSTSADSSRLLWLDRKGTKLGQLGPRAYGSNVSISRDGRQIAFDSIEADQRTRHLWTADPVRGVVTMVSTESRAWTPIPGADGVIAFAGPPDLYVTQPSAIGPPDLLYTSPFGKVPNDWSRDGRFLTFNELHPTRRSELYVLRADRREAIPLVVTDADELPAIFSPDGRWIAYSSDETGIREVYVRDFAPNRMPAVDPSSCACPPRVATSHAGSGTGPSCTTWRQTAASWRFPSDRHRPSAAARPSGCSTCTSLEAASSPMTSPLTAASW